MFLKNAWYVAAWDREVTRELRRVTVLGEHLVLYRTQAGQPIALEDACIHRKLPLSMGRLLDDHVECGYHGILYDTNGRCVHMPGSKRIPSIARIHSYPAVSRYGMVWVWMGDPAQADAETIFPVEHWDDPSWGRNLGDSMVFSCNYLFVTDNLLDPSHVAWVHRTSFGNEACEESSIETTNAPNGITAWRWMVDVEVAPFYASWVRFKGRCDRLQHYEVRYPSHAIIKAVFVPAGAGMTHGAQHPDAMLMDSYNFMTPIDEEHTRYFWFQLRNFSPEDAGVSAAMDEGVRSAFSEDRRVLEAVHESFKRQTTRHIDLAIDRPPLMFRKNLAKLIASENARNGGASS
jgi:phenylpropionate dioxygenase-like ring-hydroxylating dioxygenase large terminal subunit